MLRYRQIPESTAAAGGFPGVCLRYDVLTVTQTIWTTARSVNEWPAHGQPTKTIHSWQPSVDPALISGSPTARRGSQPDPFRTRYQAGSLQHTVAMRLMHSTGLPSQAQARWAAPAGRSRTCLLVCSSAGSGTRRSGCKSNCSSREL